MNPKQLAKYWEDNYDKDNVGDEEVKILMLNKDELEEFLLNIDSKEALIALCAFLAGALDESRMHRLMFAKNVSKPVKEIEDLIEDEIKSIPNMEETK